MYTPIDYMRWFSAVYVPVSLTVYARWLAASALPVVVAAVRAVVLLSLTHIVTVAMVIDAIEAFHGGSMIKSVVCAIVALLWGSAMGQIVLDPLDPSDLDEYEASGGITCK